MLEQPWNDRYIRIPLRWAWSFLYRFVGPYRYRWIDEPRGHWKREAVIIVYRLRKALGKTEVQK